MHSKRLNYVLLIIIAGLIAVLITTKASQASNESTVSSNNEHFLINFDQKDFKQLEDFVHRFKEGKGGNLTLIPPIVDGGYWIHDVMSNGREIHYTVDNTRDGMSSDRGQTSSICSAIDIQETEEYYHFELSQCTNPKKEDRLSLAVFLKERL
ncbi:DUF4362 domain-containing protein [Paenibacillaceae bacterium]|nr:DUF4362 domain-containing protein [Paenibacillaceae bacterium]